MSLADRIVDEATRTPSARRESLGKIAELLERNGIDLDEIGQVKRVSLY